MKDRVDVAYVPMSNTTIRRRSNLMPISPRTNRKACSPNTIQWVNDAWATGNSTAAAMMARGGKEWFFITVNFALGQGIEAEATNYIEKHGGKVLGSAKHPLNTPDFASLLLQAQNSKARVVGRANAGGDTVNAVKQAAEREQKRAGC